ncbi:TlpA family protein disulfide reductase [Paraflavitalea soli]|uniref:TlpA family protein disulfide reductase n=1 Tax=Paraflavitalea soli TaxID=2315862 RepID=A0A3B7MZF1_9BACT|nr:TlpA disulfide reductase family protein [Paraflavitalea soli]AXY78456.1 TlpA family protein disulfide reductase [Paraflavitalea soli]
MKLTILLCLLVGSMNGFAQQGAAPQPLALESPEMEDYLKSRKPAIVTIQVDNLPASAGTVGVSYKLPQLGTHLQKNRVARLSTNNTLSIILEDNLPYQQVFLTVDSFVRMGIVVNSNLHIRIDAAKIKRKGGNQAGEEVSFSGIDGDLNTVLKEYALFRIHERDSIEGRLLDQSTKTSNKRIAMAAFLLTADSVYRQLQAIDDAFIAKYPHYGEIIRNETNSLYYGLYCRPFSFREIPAPMWEKIQAHQPYFMSVNALLFYHFLSNVTVNNSKNGPANIQQLLYSQYGDYNAVQQSILDSIQYYEQLNAVEKEKSKQVLKNLYAERWKHLAHEQTLLLEKRNIQIIDSTYTGPRADLLKICLLNDMKAYFATTFPVLQAHLATDWCKRIVDFQLTQLSAYQKQTDSLYTLSQIINQDKLYIGRPLDQLPFGANLYRLDSIGKASDLIINLQARFKGQAIIIDFWATWCVPCLKDMPKSGKLHEDNKDLPVAYVYLCTTGGSNEKTWKKYVEDMKLPGTHIFVNDAIMAELKRKFNAADSYPTYVVIDLKGYASSSKIKRMWGMNRNSLKQVIGMP